MATQTEIINIQIREDGSRVVQRRLEDIGNSAERASGPVEQLKNLLATLITGAAIAQLGKLADEYTNLQNRLRLVTTGTENLTRVTKELLNISNQTRSDFTATGELYARLASTTKELGLSQRQMLDFTKSLNQAIVLSGATAAEAAGGLRQLSQGLASGTLRGDELNSVLENFPKVAQIIAEGMGHSIGQIRKLGAEGKISAQAIIDAFAQASEQLDRDFATTVPTLSQSFTVLRNNFLVFIGELNESLGVTSALSELIITIANNLDTIIPVLLAVGAAVATAFVPSLIAAFATQISALWALMLANPFVAVAAAVAGVTVALYTMRDEIKLGVDDTTTLGDLMAAVGEDMESVWTSLGEHVPMVIGFITEELQAGATYWTGITFDSVQKQEDGWLGVLRTVVQVFDMIAGTIRGVMSGVWAVISATVDNAMKAFEQLGAVWEAATNLDTAGMKAAFDEYKSMVTSGFGEMGDAFGKAFGEEAIRQSEQGLESLLDGYVKRAQELSKERLSRADSPLNGGTGNTVKPPIDEDAAKKAARELARLQRELQQVLDTADPLGAAHRRLAEAQDILNRSVERGLISQSAAAEAYEQLKFQLRDYLDPLGAVNRELDENIELLKLGNNERQIEADLLNITKTLRRDGVTLTEEETAALRAKLVVEQELAKIAQFRDSMQASSGGQQLEDFKLQVQAMRELMAAGREGGGLGAGDVAGNLQNLLPWANLENTQMQMDAYVQMHADMYLKIAELENQGVINHQTAEMLKAQADVEYMEMRLNSQRNFFGTLAGLSSSSNKKLAAIGKAAAITQATIDGVLAVQKALASAPYPYNIPQAVAAGALAAANVAQIATQSTTGFRTGGSMTVGGSGGPDSQMVAFRATPGEQIQVNTPAQAAALARGGQQAAPKVDIRQINVVDKSLVKDYLATPDGTELVLNIIEANPERVGASIGSNQ